MTAVLAQDLEVSQADIAPLCRRLGVLTLDAFWTTLYEEDRAFDGWSYAVVFDPNDPRRIAPRWVALEDALEELAGRPLEIVGPCALENPYLRREIKQTGIRIFPVSQ